MADLALKLDENVPEKKETGLRSFFTDTTCIKCKACEGAAPSIFKRASDGESSVVYKQPENEQEEIDAMNAMDGCPVQSIGTYE